MLKRLVKFLPVLFISNFIYAAGPSVTLGPSIPDIRNLTVTINGTGLTLDEDLMVSGNTVITGTLRNVGFTTLTKATLLNGLQAVTANLSGNLNVSGNTVLTGTLRNLGLTTLAQAVLSKGVSMVTASISSNLNVSGNSVFTGTGRFVGALTGTLATAAQGNITSVGTLSGLSVSGGLNVGTATGAAAGEVIVKSGTTYYGRLATNASNLQLDARYAGYLAEAPFAAVQLYASGSAGGGVTIQSMVNGQALADTLVVDQGSTTAKGGLNVGSATGATAGVIRTPYIALTGGEINEYASNSYTSLSLNYTGYNEGTTQFRDTNLYNGKQALIATFTGSDKSTFLYGGLNVGSATGATAGQIKTSAGLIATGNIITLGTVRAAGFIDTTTANGHIIVTYNTTQVVPTQLYTTVNAVWINQVAEGITYSAGVFTTTKAGWYRISFNMNLDKETDGDDIEGGVSFNGADPDQELEFRCDATLAGFNFVGCGADLRYLPVGTKICFKLRNITSNTRYVILRSSGFRVYKGFM